MPRRWMSAPAPNKCRSSYSESLRWCRFRKSVLSGKGPPADPHIAGEDDDVRRFDIRIVERVAGSDEPLISILILRPMVPVNKTADRNTRCSFHSVFLVLGRVEGLLGKTFFAVGHNGRICCAQIISSLNLQ